MSLSPAGLFDQIDAVAAEDPDRLCLRFGSEVLTYGEVTERSRQIAGALVRRGLGRGRRVGVVSHNHPLAVLSAIAILRAGAAWLPINPRDSRKQILSLLEELRCDALFFHSDFEELLADCRKRLPSLRTCVCLDCSDGGGESLSQWSLRIEREAQLPVFDPRADAAIFATGGTTGASRGVRFSGQKLAMIVNSFGEHVGHERPVFLAAMPLTHAAGRICLGVMAAGGTTVVQPKFDPRSVLAAIQEDDVTFLTVAPTMLAALLDVPEVGDYDYSSLRFLGVGAAPVPIDLLKRALQTFGPVVLQGYGQTEAPLYIAVKRPGDDIINGQLAPDDRLLSCGRASAFSELRIEGPHGEVLGPGDVGEILVRGDFVMDGYDADPQATAATRAGDSFHRTGDLGFLDADGFLTITGRAKDMVISGGFNVYPAEVENTLCDYPGVAQAAVVGLPDARWGEIVVAAVQPATGASLNGPELAAFARDRLGGVKAPKRVWIVDELPRNANGKILKREILAQLTRWLQRDDETGPGAAATYSD
jgi:acyl-CoA synthetase (AMP-forming)/AMP-acid ligase II